MHITFINSPALMNNPKTQNKKLEEIDADIQRLRYGIDADYAGIPQTVSHQNKPASHYHINITCEKDASQEKRYHLHAIATAITLAWTYGANVSLTRKIGTRHSCTSDDTVVITPEKAFDILRTKDLAESAEEICQGEQARRMAALGHLYQV